jgi:hypothetical protein
MTPRALGRIEDDREVFQSALNTISGLREQSSILSQAGSDLQKKVEALGSAIDATTDPAAKSALQREFRPVLESSQRVNEIAAGVAGASQRLGELPDRLPHYAALFSPLTIIFPDAKAQQPRKTGKSGHASQKGAATSLREKYEDTVQQQQKIVFFQNTFYALGGLGLVIILATVFGPAATRTTFVEIVKIYLPSLLSSWGTFMAAVSL